MSHHGKHGYPRTAQIRAERRARAEADHKEYNEKYPTVQSKLDALPMGGAKKQRARLEAQLQKQLVVQQATAAKKEVEQQKKSSKKEGQ